MASDSLLSGLGSPPRRRPRRRSAGDEDRSAEAIRAARRQFVNIDARAKRTIATAIDRDGSDLTPTSCEIRPVETLSAVKQEFRQSGYVGETEIGAVLAHG